MRGLFILGDGFEDTEAIATIDVLRRAKIELDYASLSDTLDVRTQTGMVVKASVFLKDIKVENYNFIVIPGGKAVFNVLDNSSILSEIIFDFADKEKLIAAICAGPTQVGKLGLYDGKDYTCFPTTEAAIKLGNLKQDKGVVVSENYITGKAMGYSIDFGLAIVEYLLGAQVKEKVKNSVFGEI